MLILLAYETHARQQSSSNYGWLWSSYFCPLLGGPGGLYGPSCWLLFCKYVVLNLNPGTWVPLSISGYCSKLPSVPSFTYITLLLLLHINLLLLSLFTNKETEALKSWITHRMLHSYTYKTKKNRSSIQSLFNPFPPGVLANAAIFHTMSHTLVQFSQKQPQIFFL